MKGRTVVYIILGLILFARAQENDMENIPENEAEESNMEGIFFQ